MSFSNVAMLVAIGIQVVTCTGRNRVAFCVKVSNDNFGKLLLSGSFCYMYRNTWIYLSVRSHSIFDVGHNTSMGEVLTIH